LASLGARMGLGMGRGTPQHRLIPEVTFFVVFVKITDDYNDSNGVMTTPIRGGGGKLDEQRGGKNNQRVHPLPPRQLKPWCLR